MPIRQIMAEARRLEILRLLAEEPDETINQREMVTALASLSHGVHPDVVEDDYRRLAELGLVTLETAGRYLMARLTDHGANVAEGKAYAPGVKRYRPD